MAPTRIILMSCGSYNPPTNMHLRMFEIARDHLHRMGTHVVVGGLISPVHDSYGKKELASADHRIAMLKAALQNNDWIRISTWETRQNIWTKTRTSLTYHQNLLNSVLQNNADVRNHIDPRDLEWIPENIKNGTDRTPIQIKLLCGGDLLESFGVPNLWEEEDIDGILGQHGLVVITREGSNPNKFIYDSDLLSRHMHNIYIVTEWICNEVSSTKIRRALKRGESVKYLIQDAVIDYINNYGLYDAKTSSTTKLSLSSQQNSNNYLHIDTKYNSAFLTPSPSDVTMASPSPVEIVSIDIAETLMQKNIQNSPKTSRTYINSDDTERMREKFINIITENVNKVCNVASVKSSYPGQAKQIIATETGESQIFYAQVGSQQSSTSVESYVINGTENDKDNNSTENNVIDKSENYIEEMDGNISSLLISEITENTDFNIKLTIETLNNLEEPKSLESIIEDCDQSDRGDHNEQSNSNGQGNEDYQNDVLYIRQIEDKPSISPPPSVPEAKEQKDNNQCQLIPKTIDHSRKFLINSSPKECNIDGKYLKSAKNIRKSSNCSQNLSEQVVPMMASEEHSPVKKEIDIKEVKNLQRSKSIKESNQRKDFQGSLESINSRKPRTLTKKSKSFEYIKGDLLVKEIRNIDFNDKTSTSKSSSSTVIAKTEIQDVQDTQTVDEYCSVCCYKDQSSNKTLYTVHSSNSSPVDVDSPECEICRSTHLQNNEPIAAEPQCEICEICGDIAMDMDVVASSRPESDEILGARLLSGSKHLPLNIKKRKANTAVKMDGRIFDIADEDADCEDNGEVRIQTVDKDERAPSTSIEEYSDNDSTLDDVEFEIENCGLDVVSSQAVITEVVSESKDDEPADEQIFDEINNINDNNIESKRITRGSSLINRTVPKPDSKKRYSSVDNLPTSKKTVKSISTEPIKIVKDQIKIAGSVDNIRIEKISKSTTNKLRKSADDVGTSVKEEGQLENSKQLTRQSEKTGRIGPDTVKFIIGKHGLKIVSDRETAL